jgi:hypothetical protein
VHRVVVVVVVVVVTDYGELKGMSFSQISVAQHAFQFS